MKKFWKSGKFWATLWKLAQGYLTLKQAKEPK